jgi:hypothetical protein
VATDANTRQPVKRRKRANPHVSKEDAARAAINRRLTKGEREALRVAAKTFYVYDLKNAHPSNMAKMPQFSGIGSATLSRWAQQGGWAAERGRVRSEWADALKRKLSDQVVHQQYDAMVRLKTIYDQAYSYATGGEDGMMPAPPKTFAEAAKLVVVLDQALQSRRNQMLDSFGVAADGVSAHNTQATTPSAQSPPGHGQMALPEMSADEYQELAHSLMAKGFTEADGISAQRIHDAQETDNAISTADAG